MENREKNVTQVGERGFIARWWFIERISMRLSRCDVFSRIFRFSRRYLGVFFCFIPNDASWWKKSMKFICPCLPTQRQTDIYLVSAALSESGWPAMREAGHINPRLFLDSWNSLGFLLERKWAIGYFTPHWSPSPAALAPRENAPASVPFYATISRGHPISCGWPETSGIDNWLLTPFFFFPWRWIFENIARMNIIFLEDFTSRLEHSYPRPSIQQISCWPTSPILIEIPRRCNVAYWQCDDKVSSPLFPIPLVYPRGIAKLFTAAASRDAKVRRARFCASH